MSVDRSVNEENRNDSPSYGANMRPMPSSAASLPPATSVCWHESSATLSRRGIVVTPPPRWRHLSSCVHLVGGKHNPFAVEMYMWLGCTDPLSTGSLPMDAFTAAPVSNRATLEGSGSPMSHASSYVEPASRKLPRKATLWRAAQCALTDARTPDGKGATSSAARIRCTRADVGDASAPWTAKRSMWTTVTKRIAQ